MDQNRLGLAISALADPTRRRIVDFLAQNDAMRISDIAMNFSASRQAITRHIDVLSEAGLVSTEWLGRERYNRLSTDGFDPIIEWLARYDQFWTARLDALKQLVERGSIE